MLREIECDLCDKPVKIPNKGRYIQMIRERRRPLCGQCRKYACESSSGEENPGSARVIEVHEETEVTAMALVKKRGLQPETKRGLASRRLRRVVKRGCEPRCHKDQ